MPLSSRTCELSTEEALLEVLTLSREVSPVRISASPAAAQGSKEAEAGFGKSMPESWAKYDPDSSSWKMSQGCLLTGLSESFSGTWPSSGMTRFGIASPLPTWELRIDATGFGSSPTHSIPTPTGQDGIERRSTNEGASNGELNYETGKSVSLDRWVKMWPTPDAAVANLVEDLGKWEERRQSVKSEKKNGNGFGMPLAVAVRMWPTPGAEDGNRGSQAPEIRRGGGHQVTLRDAVHSKDGTLNPMWVEWLMGWPLGWTVLDASAMEWFRSKPRRPGKKSKTSQESPK